MISSAIVQSAIVLMNRRMKTDRRVIRFVSVCSSVAGMHMHHLGGTNLVQARMSSVLAQYDCAAGCVECVGSGSSCLFQPLQRPSANGRESRLASQWQAVVLSLFQLGPVRRQGPRPERREEPSGRSLWSFRFRPTLSLFRPTSSLFHPTH